MLRHEIELALQLITVILFLFNLLSAPTIIVTRFIPGTLDKRCVCTNKNSGCILGIVIFECFSLSNGLLGISIETVGFIYESFSVKLCVKAHVYATRN